MARDAPHVAHRSCTDCRKYLYREKANKRDAAGTRVEDRNGNPELRAGRNLPCPCETKDGCPKGHWSNPIEWTLEAELGMRLYDIAQVSGSMLTDAEKHDGLVKAQFEIFSEDERIQERVQMQQQADRIAAAFSMMLRKE